jgi:hypothetical protein
MYQANCHRLAYPLYAKRGPLASMALPPIPSGLAWSISPSAWPAPDEALSQAWDKLRRVPMPAGPSSWSIADVVLDQGRLYPTTFGPASRLDAPPPEYPIGIYASSTPR